MFDYNKLKNIEFVITDVDGTLVNDEGKISETVKGLIKELKRSDVRFSFASGRLHSALVPIAEELKLTAPLISLDGSAIKSVAGKEYLYKTFLKSSHVKKAIEYADKYHVKIALCHAEAIYYTEQNSVIPEVMDKFGALYEKVESYDSLTDQTLEIVFAADNKEALEFIKFKFSFPFSTGVSNSFFRSQSHEGIYYLELRRSGASKGKAVRRLLDYLKINENNIAVIGDWYNDISMFDSKALKIVPKNAIPELKIKADYIINKSNNEDAIAEFLDALLKAKRYNL